MPTWDDARTQFQLAIESVIPTAVLSETAVHWRNNRIGYAKQHIVLDTVAVAYEHDFDSARTTGGAQTLNTMAQATFQVRSEAPDGSNDADALFLIEYVRRGLQQISVVDALAAEGMAITGYPGALVNLTYEADEHLVSAVAFDVLFRFILDFTPAGEDAGLIETVEAEGTVTDDAGVDTTITFTVTDPTPEP